MTKPEVLLSTASGSSPVGSAAMLTTSVVSARAVPIASNAVQARATIRCMTAPPCHSLPSFHCAGRTSCRRSSPSASSVKPATFLAQAGNVARRPEIDDRQVLAHLLPHPFIGVAAFLDVAHRAGAIQQLIHLSGSNSPPGSARRRCAGSSTHCCRCRAVRTSRPASSRSRRAAPSRSPCRTPSR